LCGQGCRPARPLAATGAHHRTYRPYLRPCRHWRLEQDSTYTLPDGIRFRLLAYGTVTDKGYIELVYVAPAIYYFERNLDDFEAVRASLTLH
jgi:hypothetical protein